MPPLVLRQRQESPSRCKMSPQRSTSSSVGLQFKKQNNNNNVNNRQLKLKKTNKRKSTKRKDKMSASSNSNFNNNVKIQTLFIACLLGIPGNAVTLYLYIKGNQDAPKLNEYHISGTNCYQKLANILPTLETVHFILEGIFLSVVAIFGLLGNLITVIVLGMVDRKSPFNSLLIALIGMDSALLIFSALNSAYISAFEFPEPGWYIFLFPYLLHPLKNIISTACVYMVVAVSIERYHAICRPLKKKPSPKFYIFVVILISVVINIPKFMEFGRTLDKGELAYGTTKLNENAHYVVFSSYHECAVIGIFPLVALCYLNYKIYKKIRKSATMKSERHFGGKGRKVSIEVSDMSDVRTNCSSNNFDSVVVKADGRRKLAPKLSSSSHSNEELVSFAVLLKQERYKCNLVVTKPSMERLCDQHTSLLKLNSYDTAAGSKDNNRYLNVITSPTTRKLSVGTRRRANSDISVTHQRKSPSNQNLASYRNRINRHNREKKSIGILLAIIVVFAVCHVFRLAVQILEIFSPRHGLLEHYERCEAEGRLHVPALAYILGNVNHLLLAVNSSVNFLIYCCIARRFRKALKKALKSVLLCK